MTLHDVDPSEMLPLPYCVCMTSSMHASLGACLSNDYALDVYHKIPSVSLDTLHLYTL